jgi:hypothetical protein
MDTYFSCFCLIQRNRFFLTGASLHQMQNHCQRVDDLHHLNLCWVSEKNPQNLSILRDGLTTAAGTVRVKLVSRLQSRHGFVEKFVLVALIPALVTLVFEPE